MAVTDRDALVTIFNSAGGTGWKRNNNWNTTAELSTWYGIKVDGQGRVVELRLDANNLRGTLALLLVTSASLFRCPPGLPLQFTELLQFPFDVNPLHQRQVEGKPTFPVVNDSGVLNGIHSSM